MLRGVRILDEVMGAVFICVDLHWSTGKGNLWMSALDLLGLGRDFLFLMEACLDLTLTDGFRA